MKQKKNKKILISKIYKELEFLKNKIDILIKNIKIFIYF